jgi:predicted esterase
MSEDPHAGATVENSGPLPAAADVAVVACHGRGATAKGMFEFAREFDRDDVAYLAPTAAVNTWYPGSFLAPTDRNEPHLSSALSLVGRVVDRAIEAVPRRRVVLFGFSQGACVSGVAACNADRYGGVVAFSGGLIEPEGTPREYDGSMDGTSVFLDCEDRDPHIPVDRVHATADPFERMEADIDERIYEGMGHGVVPEEITAAGGRLDTLTEGSA